MKLTKIHTLLGPDGVEASYDTLRRYAMQELGFRKKETTIRLEDPPAGQEAQIDFGRMGLLRDVDAERPRMLWALIITLSFSDPARVRSPKDKPRVENQVPYVRESWFDGEAFLGLDDARRSAEHWCRDIAGARVHGTTRQVPRDLFASAEKTAMLPPPTEPFDVPIWIEGAKVHPDHHIQVARALYSVPTLYLYKMVRARADKTTVKIYFGTALIKLHPRKPPGGRSTDTSDYPVGKAAYALRSVDALVTKAKEKGVHVGIYAERILAGPLPWTRMRQGYALLRLCDKFTAGRVEAVCQSALAFDVVDVTRISRMLKTAAKLAVPASGDGKGKVVQLTLPRFARPHEHFETRPGSKKEGT